MTRWWPFRIPQPEHRSVVHDIVVARLTPLQARLRADMVPGLVDRVLRREPDPEIFLAESPAMRVLAVTMHLRHAIEDLGDGENGLGNLFFSILFKQSINLFKRFCDVGKGIGQLFSHTRILRSLTRE